MPDEPVAEFGRALPDLTAGQVHPHALIYELHQSFNHSVTRFEGTCAELKLSVP